MAPQRSLPRADWEAGRRRRSPLAAIAIAAAAAAVVGTLVADDHPDARLPVDRDPGVPRIGEEDPPPLDDATAPAGGPWRRLPHSPLVRRAGHSITWTGDAAVIWGGSRPEANRRTHLASGAVYEPAAERWRRIEPAPIAARDRHTAVWSGAEVLVWGGRAAVPGPAGAAFDPSGGGWRLLPDGPLDHLAARGDGAWTGSELLVWAVHDGRLEVAVYAPDRDRWQRGEPLEIGREATAEGVWAGDRLAALVRNPAGVGNLHLYDPVGAAWEQVDEPTFPATEGFAAGGETLVLWGRTSGEQFGHRWAVTVDARTGELRRIPPPAMRLAPDHVAAGDSARLVVWDGSRGAQLDLRNDRWTNLADAPLARRTQPDGAWTGSALLVWGGGGGRYHADGALLVPPPVARGGVATAR